MSSQNIVSTRGW